MKGFALVATAILVVGVSLRWGFVDTTFGRTFGPEPDVPEYVALAHELTESGQYRVQYGEHALQSRYPPGWPLLLSLATRLGMRGEDLISLTGPVAALHAVLVAWLTLLVWHRLFDPTGAHRRAALWAALLAGIGWTTSPVSVSLANTLMSDEAGALLSVGGLTLITLGLLDKHRTRRALLLGGAMFAMSVAVRTVNLFLAVGPLACIVAAAVMQHGTSRTLRRIPLAALGALPVVAWVVVVLKRSGLDPWRWSYYSWWHQEMYDEFMSSDFAWEFVLHGNHRSHIVSMREMGHLEFGLRAFTGFCDSIWHHAGLGHWWPIAAWLAVVGVPVWAWRRGLGRRTTLFWLTIASWGWISGHLVVFAFYYFADVRFYAACLPFAWIAVAVVGCALSVARVRRGWLLAGLATVLLGSWIPMTKELGSGDKGPIPINVQATAAFEDWLSWPASEKQARVLPFDPVRVQALGLLTREARKKIQIYGPLPRNMQSFHALDHIGVLTDLEEDLPRVQPAPEEPLLVPQGAESIGEPVTWFDFDEQAYYLEYRDLAGVVEQRFRVAIDDSGDAARLRIREMLHNVLLFDGTPWTPARQTAIEHHLNRYGRTVVLSAGNAHLYVRLAGRSLEVQWRGGPALAVPPPVGMKPPEAVWRFPGFEDIPVHRDARGVFCSALRSKLTDGEVVYFTLDRRVLPCLPLVDRSASPLRVASCRPAFYLDDPSVSVDALVAAAGRRGVARLLPAEVRRSLGAFRSGGEPPDATVWMPRPESFIPGPLLALVDGRVPAVTCGAPRPQQRDRDLAVLVAFGLRPLLDPRAPAAALRDFHLLRGLSRLRASTHATDVRYFDANDRPLDLESAMRDGLDLSHPRLEIRYANGLVVRVNAGVVPWSAPFDGERLVLPPFGFTATHPGGLRVARALDARSNSIFEYASDATAEMLYGGGARVSFRNLASDGGLHVVERKPEGPELRLRGWQDVRSLQFGRSRWPLVAEFERDGRSVDVTARVEAWTSLTPAVLKVDATGLVSAVGLGKGTVAARCGDASAQIEIEVRLYPTLPPPTTVRADRGRLVLAFDAPFPLENGGVELVFGAPETHAGRHMIYPADRSPLRRRFVTRVDSMQRGSTSVGRALGQSRLGHPIGGEAAQLHVQR